MLPRMLTMIERTYTCCVCVETRTVSEPEGWTQLPAGWMMPEDDDVSGVAEPVCCVACANIHTTEEKKRGREVGKRHAV